MILSLPISTLFPFTTLFPSESLSPETWALGTEPGSTRYRSRISDSSAWAASVECQPQRIPRRPRPTSQDRKSPRLNSSHQIISYAVFCLKKQKAHNIQAHHP